jgi:hypothetical protein
MVEELLILLFAREQVVPQELTEMSNVSLRRWIGCAQR